MSAYYVIIVHSQQSVRSTENVPIIKWQLVYNFPFFMEQKQQSIP